MFRIKNGVRFLVVLSVAFLFGMLLGSAAKAFIALDPAIRWFGLYWAVFFWAGLRFLISYLKAEREHELRLWEAQAYSSLKASS